MPTVGRGKNKKTFPYTPAGMRKAREHASATGQRMSSSRSGGQRGMAKRAPAARNRRR